MATLEQLGAEKYVLLTTFRRDGRAVSTPLWVVSDGAGLAFWTVADSGKVKRIRNGGRVTLAPCDVRGKVRGEAIEAQARLGDTADRRRVGAEIKRKYGVIGRLSMLSSKLRRGEDGTIAVLVS